jgi:hypothetical protein
MAIEKHELRVSTTGSSGSATGFSALAVPLSELLAVHVDYHASAPGTTDLTLKSPSGPVSVTVLTVSNTNSDAWYYPKIQDHDNAGAAITGSYSDPPLDHFTADLAQCDALTDAVILTIYIRR